MRENEEFVAVQFSLAIPSPLFCESGTVSQREEIMGLRDEVVCLAPDIYVTVNMSFAQPACPLIGCLSWLCEKGTAKTPNKSSWQHNRGSQEVLKILTAQRDKFMKYYHFK